MFAAGARLLAVGACLFAASATASPQGAEWETLGKPEGCSSCHLAAPESGSPPAAEVSSLEIEGLPDTVVAGRRYELTIVLRDPALLIGGFLLGLSRGELAAGELSAGNERTETDGARARSTRAGALPPVPGEIRWPLIWTAPAAPGGPIRIELWGNAGNDDLSPLGDRIHHRTWLIPAVP